MNTFSSWTSIDDANSTRWGPQFELETEDGLRDNDMINGETSSAAGMLKNKIKIKGKLHSAYVAGVSISTGCRRCVVFWPQEFTAVLYWCEQAKEKHQHFGKFTVLQRYDFLGQQSMWKKRFCFVFWLWIKHTVGIFHLLTSQTKPKNMMQIHLHHYLSQ